MTYSIYTLMLFTHKTILAEENDSHDLPDLYIDIPWYRLSLQEHHNRQDTLLHSRRVTPLPSRWDTRLRTSTTHSRWFPSRESSISGNPKSCMTDDGGAAQGPADLLQVATFKFRSGPFFKNKFHLLTIQILIKLNAKEGFMKSSQLKSVPKKSQMHFNV